MSQQERVRVKADLTSFETTVNEAQKKLDRLEEKREEEMKKIIQTCQSVDASIGHIHSLVGNFIRLVSDQGIPPIGQALLTSIDTIVDTYRHSAKLLSTGANPATVYLAITFAAAAIIFDMTAKAMVQAGMSEAQANIDAAASIFREMESLL